MTDTVLPFRSPELASRGDSRLLLIDVQEKLVPHIPGAAAMVENCRKLARGAEILGVPASVTEQYPKGLGPTVEGLREFCADRPHKLRFSATKCLQWRPSASEDERHRIVVAGVEAHVCVQQTVLDLLALGYRCYVPADAVGSRAEIDLRFALERMAASGATITTTEAILFEWCETAGTPEFKEISRLVTGR